MVQHGNIVRLIRDTNYIQLNPMDGIAQASNISFDAATFEIWGALLNGARLVIMPKEALLDYEHISIALERYQITILWLTVGVFNQHADRLSDSFSRLRCLLVGGDALDPHAIREVLNQGAPQHLINGYGPTETTTFAATYEIASVPSAHEAFRSAGRLRTHGYMSSMREGNRSRWGWQASCTLVELAWREAT